MPNAGVHPVRADVILIGYNEGPVGEYHYADNIWDTKWKVRVQYYLKGNVRDNHSWIKPFFGVQKEVYEITFGDQSESEQDYPICAKCGKPVRVNKEHYKACENMHWLCFHFTFEHGDYDLDEHCEDPGCTPQRVGFGV